MTNIVLPFALSPCLLVLNFSPFDAAPSGLSECFRLDLAVGWVTITSMRRWVLPMLASISGRSLVFASRSRGSILATPPTSRIARARVCTIVL